RRDPGRPLRVRLSRGQLRDDQRARGCAPRRGPGGRTGEALTVLTTKVTELTEQNRLCGDDGRATCTSKARERRRNHEGPRLEHPLSTIAAAHEEDLAAEADVA